MRTKYTGILFSFLLASATALSAQSNSGMTETNHHRSHTSATNESMDQSGSRQVQQGRRATRMLDEVNQARTAIQNRDRQSAKQDVDEALNLADKIKNSAQTQGRLIVPIYAELEQVSVLGPIEAERGQGYAARQENPNAGNENPQTTLTPAAPAVRDVEGQYTRVSVDVGTARDHIQAAQTALRNGEWDKADSALAAVQQGVTMVSVAADLPLLRARQNLALAQTEIRNGNTQKASAPLQAAGNALQNYAQSGGTHAAEARDLSRQIQSFSHNVPQAGTQASSQVGNWWDEVASWTSSEPYTSGSHIQR